MVPLVKKIECRNGAILFVARSSRNKRVSFEVEVRIQRKDGSIRRLTSDEAGGASGGSTLGKALQEAEMLFRQKYRLKAKTTE